MAEQRAAALEAELEALKEPQESSQTAEEAPERVVEPDAATGEAAEGVQRSWWRRIFGS